MKTFKPDVLRNLINQIEPLLIAEHKDIPEWKCSFGKHIGQNRFDFNDSGDASLRLGDNWSGGYDDTVWFSAAVKIPEFQDGTKALLQLDFGGEGIVRINGKIAGSISSHMNSGWVHRDIIHLDSFARSGDTINIEVENGICCGGFCDSAMDGAKSITYTLMTARIIFIDELTQKYYFTACSALDSCGHIKDEAISSRVYEAVDNSVHMLDFDFDRKTFYASVPCAYEYLINALSEIPHCPQGEVLMCGHSHIDVAWLWTVRESERKTARTFSNTLALMDIYPNFRFTQSQAILYDFIKKYYPELFERVKRKVENGQWEIVGGVWVEADTNIASGESLIRQLLYGREFFKKEFGVESQTYWLPDCFGFSWALPQIIRRSGMKYFVTAKLSNNDTNVFPHSLFRWKAHSGDEVLAFFQKTPYSSEYTAGYINDCWNKNEQKDTVRCSMGMFGYGDGGGGCTYSMLERGKVLENMPGLPKSRMAHSNEFFDSISKEFDRLPVWDDELYYENHRGTFTSQAFVKRFNRKGEFLLRNAEILAVFSRIICAIPYPSEKLEETWKLLLVNQFHDILPGTSIHEVYTNTRRELEQMTQNGNDILESSLNAINKRISLAHDSIVVWNTQLFKTDACVSCEIPYETATVFDSEMNMLDSTVTREDGKNILCFIAKSVESMGFTSYKIVEGCPKKGSCVKVEKKLLENEFLRVELDDNGLLTSVFDKTNNREVLAAPSNLLTVYQDKPIHESAWNLEINYSKKRWDLIKADSVEVTEASPVRGVIEIRRSFNRSTIKQQIILEKKSHRVDFDTTVDWNETEKMLKASFPVAVRSTKASYEIAHGSIERPTHSNTSYDFAKFEVCAHKWADLSEGDYGVSILNDCKYGYDIRGNTMGITLMRAPNCPDRTGDHGINRFVYSLFPHKGGWRDSETLENALILNNPLKGFFVRAQKGILPKNQIFISISNKNIVLDCLKQAQDSKGIILRLYEAKSTRGVVDVCLSFPFSKVYECNMMEVNERELPCDNGCFDFKISPNEVKTFRII